MTRTSNANIVLGRGELYFDRFADGTLESTGELYLGNTPGFTIKRSYDEVQRFTSYGGQKIQRGSVITREQQSATIKTDNIDSENIAIWFGGFVKYGGQAAIGEINETIKVRTGRWYQLGKSFDPFGVRYVEPDIKFRINNNLISTDDNFILDRVEGRFFVLDDAADITGQVELLVTFQWRQSFSKDVVLEKAEIVGALRYISKNPTGVQFSYLFPYVVITPTSEIDMKGDNWQEIPFDVTIRKLNPLAEFVYIKEFAKAEYTEDEQAIIDLGPMTLEEFPYWEDQLDYIINTAMPEADYGQVIVYP